MGDSSRYGESLRTPDAQVTARRCASPSRMPNGGCGLLRATVRAGAVAERSERVVHQLLYCMYVLLQMYSTYAILNWRAFLTCFSLFSSFSSSVCAMTRGAVGEWF